MAAAHGAGAAAPDPVSVLSGGVAVVSGGAGAGAGLGQGLVRRLAAEGMRVAVLDLDRDAAEALAAELRAGGSEAIAWAVDVTETDTLRRAVEQVRDAFGACNVLCAHVGGGGQGRFESIVEEQWLAAMKLMVVGTVATVQAFLPLMRETRGVRRIVLTSSAAALAPGRYQGPYRAAKSAVTSIGETLDLELGPEGIGTTVAFPSGMQHPDIIDLARSMGDLSTEAREALIGDPVTAAIAEEMAPRAADIETGDAAAQSIVDALIEGRRYVITHGVTVEQVSRARQQLLDDAFAELAARRATQTPR